MHYIILSVNTHLFSPFVALVQLTYLLLYTAYPGLIPL